MQQSTEPTAGRLVPGTRVATARAAVGGLLVALAALGVFAAWSRSTAPPTTTFLVAAHDVGPGSRLEVADLVEVAIDLPPDVAGGTLADIEDAVGAVTIAPLATGDLLRASAVLLPSLAGDAAAGAPPGFEVSLTLDRARAVAGALAPGESVDVVATFGSGVGAWTEVLAHRAAVIGLADPSDGGFGGSGQIVVTLEVARAQDVLEVVHASDAGTITLVRATRVPSDDGDADAERDTDGERGVVVATAPAAADSSGGTGGATP